MAIHDHGTTAVVTGILRLEGRTKSGRFDRRYRFTDTWLRQGGTWRIIAAQDYLIPRA
jgi:ketosteroid isomerase-like protein